MTATTVRAVTTSPAPARLHGLRFAFGTLTVLPARVARWDREAARAGMLCAPVAGLVVGLCAAAAGGLLLVLGAGPLLAAVAAVAVPALLTQGPAPGRPRGHRRRTGQRQARRGRAAHHEAVRHRPVRGPHPGAVPARPGRRAVRAVRAGVGARRGRRGARGHRRPAGAHPGLPYRGPAARPEGLGAVVAGTVPPRAALTAAAVVLAGCAAAGAALPGAYDAVRHVLAALVALVAAEVLLRRCVRRFGGVTGGRVRRGRGDRGDGGAGRADARLARPAGRALLRRSAGRAPGTARERGRGRAGADPSGMKLTPRKSEHPAP